MLKRVRAEALSPRIESRLRCDSGDDSVDDDDVHTGGGTSTKRVLAAGVIMLVAALAIEPIPHFRMANAHRDRPGALEFVRTWDDRRGVLPVSDVRDQEAGAKRAGPFKLPARVVQAGTSGQERAGEAS